MQLYMSFVLYVTVGVDHAMLKQVGEQFLNIRSGAGTVGSKAMYRGGRAHHYLSNSLNGQHLLLLFWLLCVLSKCCCFF